MAKCDLCDCFCYADELETLRDSFQLKAVIDLCPACAKWANDNKNKLVSEVAPRMRELIAYRKGQLCGTTPMPWWRRILKRLWRAR